jgi:hypothetical protein
MSRRCTEICVSVVRGVLRGVQSFASRSTPNAIGADNPEPTEGFEFVRVMQAQGLEWGVAAGASTVRRLGLTRANGIA